MNTYRTKTTHTKHALLQERIKNTLDLTFAKVAAHIYAPQQYAMPADNNALENKILRFYRILKPKEQEKFLLSTNLLFNQSAAANNKRFEDLMEIDLKSPVAMLEKIKAHPLPEKFHFTEKDIEIFNEPVSRFVNLQKPKTGLKVALQQVIEPQTLSLTLDTIKCVDPQDLIKDEIFFSGFTIDALGNNESIPFTSAGKFKKDDSKALQLKLRDFNLLSAGFFPQDFLVGLFIFEKDSKKDDVQLQITMELIQDIGLWILAAGDAIAIAALAVTLGGAMPAGFALAIVALAMGAIGLLLIGIVSLVNNLRLAEISIQITDQFTFDTNTLNPGQFVLRKFNVDLIGSTIQKMTGKYEITLKWTGVA